jgi:hypothetical protein
VLQQISFFNALNNKINYIHSSFGSYWGVHIFGVEKNFLVKAFVVAKLLPNIRNFVGDPVLLTSCVKFRFCMPYKN